VVNLSPFYQMAIQGIAILIAIIANTSSTEQRRKMLARRKLA
jgi:ribose/xylose/arabinose/galactoside ABC-type transport system permease subunit